MNKVLIITHDFEPLNSIGAKRPESWHKYFPKFDIHPIVLCRKWDIPPQKESDYYQISASNDYTIEETNEGTVIRYPFRGTPKDKIISKFGMHQKRFVRKLYSLAEMFLGFHMKVFDPTPDVLKVARSVLNNHSDIIAILATGEPWRNFKYASVLSRQFNIPWVADYRDGWSTNVSYSKGFYAKYIYRPYNRYLEKKIVKSSAAISISDPCEVVKIEKLFAKKSLQTIYNGFDLGSVDPKAYSTPKDVLTISYAGSLYPFQPVELFLEGLKDAVEHGKATFQVNFIGTGYSNTQKERILSYDASLHPYLNISDRIPHEDVLKQLAASHILLLFASPDAIALPAKIFEYFGLQRKILVVRNDNDVVENLIQETSSGTLCDSSQQVSEFLLSMQKELSENNNIACNTKNYHQYSRENQAKAMSSFLRSVANSNNTLN